MTSDWFLWCIATSEFKAHKLLKRTLAQLEIPYPTDVGYEPDVDIPGYSIHFQLAPRASSWAEAVLELLTLGCKTAGYWTVLPNGSTSTLQDSIEAFSDESKVPGVRRVFWNMNRLRLADFTS